MVVLLIFNGDYNLLMLSTMMWPIVCCAVACVDICAVPIVVVVVLAVVVL